MLLTNDEREAVRATLEFWRKNEKAPQSWRNRLVEEFTEQWRFKVDLTKPIMRHPKIYRKQRRKYSILEVLADFILDVEQVAERNEEYPVQNREKMFNDEKDRIKNELSIVFDSDYSGDDYRTPPYSIEEYTFNTDNPVEDALFRKSKAETVEELRALLRHVKDNAELYVKRYADPTKDWNEETKDKKRTPENVRKAIYALELDRVRECKICGGAFYAHDRRQVVCDIQKDKNSNYSTCQKLNKRINEKMSRDAAN